MAKAFKLASYRWERTSLYLEFDELTPLSQGDGLSLKGWRYDPELDAHPSDAYFQMTACSVEGPTTMRVRFLLGQDGNPVRPGDYQFLVRRLGGEYPILVEEEQIDPEPTSNKRSDVLLYTKTSSYYEVIPVCFEGRLYCAVGSLGMPSSFDYQSKQKLKLAEQALLEAAKRRFAVRTYDRFRLLTPSNPKKVLFTSDSRKSLSGNMEPLYQRMVERGLDDELDIVFSFNSNSSGTSQGRDPLSYLQLAFHLATARVVFCDDYQPFLYFIKLPKKTRFVQLWHACGHFKTVGWGRIGTLDAAHPFVTNHRNYTDVIVASESDVPIYGEAFGIMDECVKPYGIPRHDWLLDSDWQKRKREAFAEAYPRAAGKKVIVFAPTFRGAGKKTARYDYDRIDFAMLGAFCRERGYCFILKMHPFIKQKPQIPEDCRDVLIDGSDVREINDILPSTDILVTDYSSVMYEAALLDIPTVFYAYDLENYISSRSFYEPFEGFVSGKIVRTFDELLRCIDEGDFELEKLAEFKRKNFKYLDGRSCDRIIDEIVLPAVYDDGKRFSPADVRVINLSRPAAEINAELADADEPLVLFTDEGAEYKPNYIEGVLRAFNEDPDMGAASGLVLNHKGAPLSNEVDVKHRKIVHNAHLRFSQGVYLPYGVIYRTDVIREHGLSFDEELVYCRDELFAIQYMECAGKNARLNRFKYRTAKVLDETGPKTPQSYDKRWYTDSTLPLMRKLASTNWPLPNAVAAGEPASHADGYAGPALSRIAQFGLLYLTMQRFKSNQGGLVKMAFDGPEDTDAYLAEVAEVLRAIDDEVLFNRAKSLTWEMYKKIYFAQLRDPSRPLELKVAHVTSYGKGKNAPVRHDAVLRIGGDCDAVDVCKMSDQRFVVTTMKYACDAQGRCGIDIRMRLPRAFPVASYRLILRNSFTGGHRDYEAVWETPVAGIMTFFDHYACRQDTFHAFVPLEEGQAEQVITLYAQFDGFRVKKSFAFSDTSWGAKLSTEGTFKYWYFDGHIAQSPDGTIKVRTASDEDRASAERGYQRYLNMKASMAARDARKNPKSKKLAKQASHLARVAELRKLYWQTLDEFEGRHIWTYYDKSYKAGDNAEYALRYAAAQDDGIEKIFFISPKSKDSQRLKEEGFTVMDPSTIEAELVALHADIVHMTHVPPFLKLGLGPSRVEFFNDLLDARVVRVYHGYPITRSASYAQISDDSAGVVIGSEYERELYTNDDNGFAPEQVIDSGMPRYDDLVDDSRKQILFAPTWRPTLAGKSIGGGVSAYNPKFKDSVYFERYEQIMNDERVLEAAREHGYKIKMFLHPKMNAQVGDFSSNDVVESLSCTEDIDYVTIMQQSDLMITDYSSVQYDFAYMRKPVVYYHDPLLPYWRLVDFDYGGIGFGEVCESPEELVEVLVDYMRNGCVMKDAYRQRVESFFVHSDRESGRRLYEADLKLQEQVDCVPQARLVAGDLSKAEGL